MKTGDSSDPRRRRWVKLRARYSNLCGVCNLPFGGGSVMWWHPYDGLLCDGCAKADDLEVRKLTEEERRIIRAAKEQLSQLDSLPTPLKPSMRTEYDNSVKVLQTYSHIVSVQRFLNRLTYLPPADT